MVCMCNMNLWSVCVLLTYGLNGVMLNLLSGLYVMLNLLYGVMLNLWCSVELMMLC
jgi:hypothetical protein